MPKKAALLDSAACMRMFFVPAYDAVNAATATHMFKFAFAVLAYLCSFLRSRHHLGLEILALRQ